jgi:Arc-like DNA binding domain
MSRRPAETVQINLRIKEGLRRRLEREAERHKVSMNMEIRMRLEDSLEAQALKSLEASAADLETNALRLGALVVRLELSQQLAEKLAKTKDPEIAALANAWLQIRKQEDQQ